VSAGLQWGVKESLLRYVSATPDGKVELDGVSLHENVFTFPLESVEGVPGSGVGRATFTGTVRLFGPFGMPIQELIDPWIEWSDSSAWLSVVRWSGRPERLRGWSVNPLVLWEGEYRAGLVQLTAEGSQLFGQQYTPATEFDRLSFVID
jgi:hypothetical protein